MIVVAGASACCYESSARRASVRVQITVKKITALLVYETFVQSLNSYMIIHKSHEFQIGLVKLFLLYYSTNAWLYR